ncbi:MAG TPA: hypothetical protein VEZ50_10385 [Nodosilinea sp.]|nr:hypothetical protein [Nodosilinea sp.]
MRALGFYPYQKFSIDQEISEEEIQRENFAAFVREAIYKFEGDGWLFLVSRDGLVQYHRDDLEALSDEISATWEVSLGAAKSHEPVWISYLTHLNVIYFLLECSMHLSINIIAFEFFELTYLDTTRITYEDGEPIRQVNYGGLDLNEMIRFGSYKPNSARDFERFVMPRSVLDGLCNYYLMNIINNQESVNLLHRVAKALSEHNLRSYDNSLVMSWFLLETYINTKWEELLESRNILGKRKATLKGRDYTASVKTEILEMHNLITLSRYEQLNRIRKARNDIAHNFGSRSATRQESGEALMLVQEIIEERLNLKFPYHTNGTPIHGL